MAFFDKETIKVISDERDVDLSKATFKADLSSVDYDSKNKFFYITIDKVLFTNPLDTIKSVLEAHGFVSNIENILFCFDSLIYCVRAKISEKGGDEDSLDKVNEYIPCVRFELPQKNKVGEVLQAFYDVIANYESKNAKSSKTPYTAPEPSINRNLSRENERLKNANKELAEQVRNLSEQLLVEKKSLNQASRALDSQQALPGNTKLCRVEHVDLKRRLVKVKSFRKIIEIPTHMLDRVPDFKARCLITFDEDEKTPLGILFFNNEELGSVEKRTADLLYVEGDTFKARDSMRNEFQIKAVNDMEEATIKDLQRGMQVLVSVADGYVVRFSVLNASNSNTFTSTVREQLVVYDIGRNQLADFSDSDE